MTSKKIEPTDAMVDEAANALFLEGTGESLCSDTDEVKGFYRDEVRPVLRAALNHPDAAALFESEWKSRAVHAEDALSDSVHVDEAARRVEAAREQGWDEAARKAMDGGWIDSGDYADLRAWNPYRPVQELPDTPKAVIVANDGHETITATTYGETWHAREAVLSPGGDWLGAWRSTDTVLAYVAPHEITPGTWRIP